MSNRVKGLFPVGFKGGGFLGTGLTTNTRVHVLPHRVTHPSYMYYRREDCLLGG